MDIYGKDNYLVRPTVNDVDVVTINDFEDTKEVYVCTHHGSDTTGVGSRFNPYATIAKALSEITDNSASNRYKITLFPGLHTSAPVTMKSYVSLAGTSTAQTIIVASNTSSTLITMPDNSSVFSVTLTGVTSGTIIENSSGGNNSFTKDIILDNSQRGVYMSSATNMTMINTQFTSTITTGIDVNTTGFTGAVMSGVLSQATTTFKTSSQSIGQGLIRAFTIGIYGGTQALFADGGIIDIHTLCQSNCPNCIKTDNGGRVEGFGFDLHYVTGNHIEQLNTADYIKAWSSSFHQDQLSLVNVDNVLIDFDDDKEGDEGYTFYKEVKIGAPEKGREAVFGEGDSYTRGMLVYSYNGSSITDISDDMKNINTGSSIFPGTSGSAIMYVSNTIQSSLKYYGLKVDVDTAMDVIFDSQIGTSYSVTSDVATVTKTQHSLITGQKIEIENATGAVLDGRYEVTGTPTADTFTFRASVPDESGDTLDYAARGELEYKYWDGSNWSALTFMATDSSSPYERHAKDQFEEAQSYQIRFEPDFIDNWQKNDPVSYGQDLYWIKLELKYPITSAPVFNQFKLHPSRFESNDDGYTEYFGNARPRTNIEFNYNTNQAFGDNPATQDIWLYDSDDVGVYKDIGYGGVRNEFVNGDTNKIGNVFILPKNLDSSGKVRINIFWFASATGNIYFHFNAGLRGVNESIGESKGQAPFQSDPTGGLRNYFTAEGTAPNNVSRRINKFSIDIPVDEIRDDDILWVSFAREGGNASDTLAGAAYIIQTSATYLKWTEGAHI